VRKAQLQLATLFSVRNDEKRARRICRDRRRAHAPLLRLKKELEAETRPHYWEFTERGLNFAFLAPDPCSSDRCSLIESSVAHH
jgi:hypothetical protein